MGENPTLHTDLWGTYIQEMKEEKPKSYGAGDSHILFLGKSQSGKTALQNMFFGKSDETNPTIVLAYQSCGIKVNGKEKTLHFWELGEITFEGVLQSVVTPETQNGFTIFLCFDLTSSSSILECLEWLDMIEMRFKEGKHALFLVGTHYDLFEPKSPQDKEIVVQGLRALAQEHNAGLVFTSTKMENLITRFKNVIKFVCIGHGKVKEKETDISKAIIFGPGADSDFQPKGEEIAELMNKLSQENALEKKEKSQQSLRSLINDPNLAEEDIVSLAAAKRAELRASAK